MDKTTKTKTAYTPPQAEVTQVSIEGSIAQATETSFQFMVNEFELDTTPQQPYDGDVWLWL
jgi:hypothetical protein